LDPIVKVKNQS